jgi:hypothetical protein
VIHGRAKYPVKSLGEVRDIARYRPYGKRRIRITQSTSGVRASLSLAQRDHLRRRRLLREVLSVPVGRLRQIISSYDVVPPEHGGGFVTGEVHRDILRDSSAVKFRAQPTGASAIYVGLAVAATTCAPALLGRATRPASCPTIRSNK